MDMYRNVISLLSILIIISISSCSKKLSEVLSPDGQYIDVSKLGVTDDSSIDQTQKIQKIFLKYAGVGKFFFPAGTYKVSQLNIYPGIHIKGTDDTWFLKKEKSAKFNRMFNTIEYMHSGSKDSKLISIANINIDGNRLKQGEYKKHQLEHQAMIFLVADKKTKGRLKVDIRDCHFEEGVGDAISIYSNVDAVIENCTAHNVFRGSITITGGYSKVMANSIKATGDVHVTGVDIEVDGVGYGKSKRVEVEFTNMELAGDFDIGIMEASTFYGQNIKCYGPPYSLYAHNSKLSLKDCEIHTGNLNRTRVYFPHNVTIENTDFYIKEDTMEDLGAMLVYWSTKYSKNENQNLNLINCNFYSKVTDKTKNVYGIKTWADDYEHNNVMTMKGVKFEGNFTNDVFMKQGGNIKAEDVQLSGDKKLYLGSTTKNANFRYKVQLDKVASKNKGNPISTRITGHNELILDKQAEKAFRSN